MSVSSAIDRLHPDERPFGYDSWVEKRKREFRGGRHFARRALGASGAPHRALPPDVDGVPCFPTGFVGCITHTGKERTFVAAAATREPRRVGIDAEQRRDLPEDMTAHVLSQQERAALAQISAEQSFVGLRAEGERALLAFSAKEAFYKCVFPVLRKRIAFHDVFFSLIPQKAESGSDAGYPTGHFEVRVARDLTDFPKRLMGRYLLTPKYVICGVDWFPSAD